MQLNSTGIRKFPITKNIESCRRVKMLDGSLVLAGASDYEIGTTMVRGQTAEGDDVQVILRTTQGTVKMIASEAIAQGGDVYAAADGKVGATDGSSGYPLIGTALTTATDDGEDIEILRR